MTDLLSLLELATDGIESPDLAGASLATARRRRTWRRATVASVAAGIAVVAILVAPRAVTSPDPVREPAGTPNPSPAPSPTEEGGVAPAIRPEVVQQRWDPSTIRDLPYYPLGLPTVLAPVGGSSPQGAPDGVLALSRSEDDRLAVLYGERGWYGLDRVPEVGDIWDSSLSRDGTRMAVVGQGGLFWCPAAEECSEWTEVQLPGRVQGEDMRITWTPDPDRLVVTGLNTGYLVDLDRDDLTELPYLADYAAYGVASDGTVVSVSLEPRAVVEWEGATQLRSTASGDLGGLDNPAAFGDTIAATRIDLLYSNPRSVDDGDGLVVLDRDGLTTRAFLPFTGRSGQWVDGAQVKPLQWLNRLTVLVSVLDAQHEMVHLVTWDTSTENSLGEQNLGYVTSYPASYDVDLRDLYPS